MSHIQKVWYTICTMVCSVLMLSLSGCALGGATSVEDLLRAPMLSGDYMAIQSAMSELYGQDMQLRYPTEGDLLSPYLFGDWDGDGKEDVAVLFTIPKSAVVRVAILRQNEDGWEVFGVADGLSDMVETVQFARMQDEAAQQIIVTFLAQGERYLAVYSYEQYLFSTVFQSSYEYYLLEEFTGSDRDDLVLVSTDVTTETMQVQLLTFGEDGFTEMIIPGLSSALFSDYANLVSSLDALGRRYLVFDGWTNAENSALASSILMFNSKTQLFEQTDLLGTNDLYTDSLRYYPELLSRDIDGDGVIEIPVQPSAEDAGLLNYVQEKRVVFVKWMDFTKQKPEKSFGLYDVDYGYYIALPWELDGNLLITDGDGKDTIELRNLAGDELYLTLRIVSLAGGETDWRSLGMVDSKQIQIKIEEPKRRQEDSSVGDGTSVENSVQGDSQIDEADDRSYLALEKFLHAIHLLGD